MIDMLKYRYWYYVSHWHYLGMNRCITLQQYYLNDREKFRKYFKKFLYHVEKFDEIQVILDDLKEKICQKYPDLREEAE